MPIGAWLTRLRRWPWRRLLGGAVRLGLVLTLFSWIRPPQPNATLGPPQTVQTNHPILCVHTRLTDEVEPWKVLLSLQMVRELGAPTIVEYFPWAYAEGQKGSFGWSHADMVVNDAANQGLTVVARLGGLVPDWARQAPGAPETVDTLLPYDRFSDFGDYVYAFVSHFKGRVPYII